MAIIATAGASPSCKPRSRTRRCGCAGFYGAAKAAEAGGDAKKARGDFEKLARLTRYADGDRPELREAKQRLASK